MTVLRVSEAVCKGFPSLRIAAVVARGFSGHEPWPETADKAEIPAWALWRAPGP